MSSSLGSAVFDLQINQQAYQKGLDAAHTSAQRFAKDTGSVFDHLSDRLSRVGQAMSLGVTAPIVGIGTVLGKMAIDAVESTNLFDVSMGKMAGSARDWSHAISTSLGLNQIEVQRQVGTLDVMIQSMGLSESAAYDMSKSLTTLGYDMASFYNLSNTDAFEKISAGLSGEMEPLKRLGILVNETTSQQWALTHGLIKQGQEMSEVQKITARYGVIMEATSKAQGDLARTADSPANMLRRLRSEFEGIGIEVGSTFLPLLSQSLSWIDREGVPRVIEAVNSMKAAWNSWGAETQRTVGIAAGLFLVGGPILIGLAGAIKLVGGVVEAYRGLAGVFGIVKVAAEGKTVALGVQTATEAASVGSAGRLAGAFAKIGPIAGAAGIGILSLANAGAFLGTAGVLGGIVGKEVGNAIGRATDQEWRNQDWGDLLTTARRLGAMAAMRVGEGFGGENPEWRQNVAEFFGLLDTASANSIVIARSDAADWGRAWKEHLDVLRDYAARNAIAWMPTGGLTGEGMVAEKRLLAQQLAMMKAAGQEAETVRREQQDAQRQARTSPLGAPTGLLAINWGTKEEYERGKALIGKQLERIKLAEQWGVRLSEVERQYPILQAGAEDWLATLPRSETELQKVQAQLEMAESIKFGWPEPEKVKAITPPLGEIAKALAAMNPAAGQAQAGVDAVAERLRALDLALSANQDQIKAAEDEYSRLGDRVKGLKDELSNLQRKLQDLSSTPLKGETAADKQIATLERQLQRLRLAGGGQRRLAEAEQQFPELDPEMAKFLDTLAPNERRSAARIQQRIDRLRLTKSLQFDQQHEAIKEAVEGTRTEMSPAEVMAQIAATKGAIVGKEGEITTAEAAQQALGDRITSLKAYQEQLNLLQAQENKNLDAAKTRLETVNKGLELSYGWLLEGKKQALEWGATLTGQIGGVDGAIKNLLATIGSGGDVFGALAKVTGAQNTLLGAAAPVPGRSLGGAVKAGSPYWVGEKGIPELFVPNLSGTIVPGGRGSQSITVQFGDVHINNREDIEVLAYRIGETIRARQ